MNEFDKMGIIQTRCGLCQSSDYQTLFRKNGYNFVRCRQCGLVYVNPRDDEASAREYYSEKYFTGGYPEGFHDYSGEKHEKIRDFSAKLSLIGKHIKPGRLLDVGCAYGYSLLAASRLGWDPSGVEFSSHAVKHARENLGLENIFNGALEHAGIQSQSLDAVTLWDVVEHLPDPVSTLREVNRILRPGGIAAFTVPNAGSLLARLSGRRWHQFNPREHYNFFTRRTLARLLAMTGFLPVRMGRETKFASMRKLSEKLGPPFTPLKVFGARIIPIPMPDKLLVIAKKSDQKPEARARAIRLHMDLAPRHAASRELGGFMAFNRRWNRTLMDVAGSLKGKNILECGCGAGLFLDSLAPEAKLAVGADLSLDMLSAGPREAGRSLVNADAALLPFRDHSFDVVFFRGSLYQMRPWSQVLAEVRRVLAPEGVLVFSEPVNDSRALRWLRGIAYRSGSGFIAENIPPFSLELLSALGQAGFRVERRLPFGFSAFALFGNPAHFRKFNFVPFADALARAMIQLDKVVIGLLGRSAAFHVLVKARPVKAGKTGE